MKERQGSGGGVFSPKKKSGHLLLDVRQLEVIRDETRIPNI